MRAAIVCLGLWIASVGITARAELWLEKADRLEMLRLSDVRLSTDEERNNAFLEAKCAYETREADALQLVRSFLANYPSGTLVPEARLMEADLLLYDKDFSQALEAYNSIPAGAFAGNLKKEFTYRKAYALLKTGYFDEALPLFRSLVSDSEYSDAALFYDAYISYVEGDYDSAYDKFTRVGSKGEKGLETDYYINQIEFRRCEYDRVIKNSRKLLASEPADELLPETLRVTALAYFKKGDVRNAKNYLEQYIDIAEEPEVSALYSLGTIYYDEGSLGEAEALFGRLTDDRNDLAQSSWLYLGQIYSRQGNDQAASIAFDKAARMAWDSKVSETASYNMSVAGAEGNTVPFADSATLMEQFVASYPNSIHASEVSRYLAAAYYNQRNYTKALETLDKSRMKDNVAEAMRQKILFELGKSQLTSGQTDRALKTLSEAAACKGDAETLANIQLWLGDALYAKGRYQEAVKAYTAALDSGKLGENEALARYDLGYTYFSMKQYAKARPYFSDALSGGLNPTLQTDARLRLGDCLYYGGDYTGALAAYRKAAETQGAQSTYALLREADILALQGNVSEEIRILSNLADNGAGVWTKEVLTRLADAYSVSGQDGNAARIYGRLLDSGLSAEDGRQMYYSLAANASRLYEAGNTEEAYSLYRRLASSGEEALYQDAVIGLMRTASDCAEITENAEQVRLRPVQPEVLTEANVRIAECDVKNGRYDKAEKALSEIIDEGADGGYWLARAYLALTDIYMAQDKENLAKMYLETLKENYPGNEKEIREMINSRLKKLK